MSAESVDNREVSPEEGFANDHEQPIERRIDMARYLANRSGETITVLLAQYTCADGNGSYSKKYMEEPELVKVDNDYGFPPNQYVGDKYDARTKSTLFPDLTFQVTEGPFVFSRATEAFPNATAWSSFDYVLKYNVLVTPS